MKIGNLYVEKKVGVKVQKPEATFHVKESNFDDLSIFERSENVSNGIYAALKVLATKVTDMATGFGVAIGLFIRDDAGIQNQIGRLCAVRENADNSGSVSIGTANSGLITEKFFINSIGEFKNIVELTVGENISANQPLYIKSDGKLWKANASSATTTLALFISTEAKNADQVCRVYCVHPIIKDNSWSWSVGGIVYVSTTGTFTQTRPTGSGDQVFIIGIALSATKLVFAPGLCYVEVA